MKFWTIFVAILGKILMQKFASIWPNFAPFLDIFGFYNEFQVISTHFCHLKLSILTVFWLKKWPKKPGFRVSKNWPKTRVFGFGFFRVSNPSLNTRIQRCTSARSKLALNNGKFFKNRVKAAKQHLFEVMIKNLD